MSDLIACLREAGRAWPGVHGKSPWPGHDDLAVNDKTFAYLSAAGDPPKASLKLPFSAPELLERACATPTHYGLGKAGWVTLDLAAPDAPDLEALLLLLDESYRAQAPKRLVKTRGAT